MLKLLSRLGLLAVLLVGTAAPIKLRADEGLCGCDALGENWFCKKGCDRTCSGGACVETCESCSPPLP